MRGCIAYFSNLRSLGATRCAFLVRREDGQSEGKQLARRCRAPHFPRGRGHSLNNRRDLIIAFGAATLFPKTLFAQTKQPILIGWLSLSSRESGAHSLVAFQEGLSALGGKKARRS